ncbi:MAG: Fic family protein [Candidatus Curtissbacteria bacterium]|nr:Fic family protein [Candidatus Curtissbacteria bacterium]
MAKSTKPKSATSFKETAFGILPRSRVVILEQEGIKKAQQYILKLSDKKAEITPELICAIHKEGFGFIFPGWAGKFRAIDVTVGEYEPPHYSSIPEFVKNLCEDLKERLKYLPSPKNQEQFLTEVISLLAWFQHRLVWIHPFQDYNGRVARLLTNLLALNLGLPLLIIKADTGQDREAYIKAMKAADKNDYSKLESIIASALKKGLIAY